MVIYRVVRIEIMKEAIPLLLMILISLFFVDGRQRKISQEISFFDLEESPCPPRRAR